MPSPLVGARSRRCVLPQRRRTGAGSPRALAPAVFPDVAPSQAAAVIAWVLQTVLRLVAREVRSAAPPRIDDRLRDAPFQYRRAFSIGARDFRLGGDGLGLHAE